MSPRDRRLWADLHAVQELVAQLGSARYVSEGQPPDRYLLDFEADGLARGQRGEPIARRRHQVAAYLHIDYPRRAPLLVWQTPIFHPNILPPDRHGAVCLGAWSPSESLADVLRRVVDLAAWRSFSLDDALDKDAAAWARDHGVRPGAPLSSLAAHA